MMHLSMKSLLVFSALLLSASPAVADDLVYLECPIIMHATFVDAETLEVVDSISEDELMVFEIDVKNKTFIRDNTLPEDVEIRDGHLIYSTQNDGREFNLKLQFDPPGNISGSARGAESSIRYGKEVNVSAKFAGSCQSANQ